MKKTITPILLILFILIIIGCSSTVQESTPPIEDNTSIPSFVEVTEPAGNTGYPVVEINEPGVAYPPYPDTSDQKQSLPYPAKEEHIYDESKRIAFDKPVVSGTIIISGSGPANIVIRIVSVSNVGESLGSGVIDADGRFEITLSRQIESKEAVAIMLSDDSLRSDFLNAPGATDIPMLGFVLDIAVAE